MMISGTPIAAAALPSDRQSPLAGLQSRCADDSYRMHGCGQFASSCGDRLYRITSVLGNQPDQMTSYHHAVAMLCGLGGLLGRGNTETHAYRHRAELGQLLQLLGEVAWH